MEALMVFEDGDNLTLKMKDMQEKKVTFRGYDFESEAMIVDVYNNLEALEFDTIDHIIFEKPIRGGWMINTKLALSQQTIDRWRDSNRTRSAGTGVNPPVGSGVLTASTSNPIPAAK